MRTRAEIEKHTGQGSTTMEHRTLEVLLDIRELLQERPQSTLTDLGGPLRPAQIDKAVAKLREVAKFMSTGLSREVQVVFSFLDGGRSVYEFRVKEAAPPREHVLFRAIVGAAGLPVVLDLFEDNKPVCKTLEEVPLHVVAFLAHPDVQRMIVSTRGSEASSRPEPLSIRMARRAALALKEKYGNKVEVTLRDGEVHVFLAKDQPMDSDIEQIADVVQQLHQDGHQVTLKNRDNPIPR